METKIQKWGNSLGVRLPKAIADRQDLMAGSTVKLTVEEDKIVIERVGKTRYTIDELVTGITSSNLHQASDWGKPIGKEIW